MSSRSKINLDGVSVMAKEATKCPITRAQFAEHGKDLIVEIDGTKTLVPRKEFKGATGEVDGTGSLGWYYSGKTVVVIDGVACKVQMQISMQLVGSKIVAEEAE